MRSLLLAASPLAVLSALATSATAQTTDDPDTLSEVVVTATRLPAVVQDTPGARVIDRRAIDQRGAVFAADILADVPGLSVTRTGLAGPAQVRMRGAAPGKTLVLVDGAPVNDAAEINGAADLTGFDLGDIDRIEVLSGPQSSLWGSDAIGGVIAFTTRDLDGLALDAEAGSFGTVRGRLAGGVIGAEYAASAWIAHFDTDGISAADEADGNPEADGFTATTVGVKGRRDLTATLRLDGSARWSKSAGGIDGAFPVADTFDTFTREQRSAQVGASIQALGLSHRFSVAVSDVERGIVSSFPSTFEADRQAWRWQADGEARGVAFAFGAEREDSAGSLSTGASVDLGTTSAFATARANPIERLTVTGTVRLDDTDDFGSKTTGRVSAAYDLGAGLTLSGAYGTGFKAPTVSQSACDFCYGLAVNPLLRPETAEGYEAALGWRSADGRIEGRATIYRLKVEDQIAPEYGPGFSSFTYVNLERTRTDGVELEGRAILPNGFDLSLAYAWTDAKDDVSGLRLLRVPERSGSATLGWTGQKLSAALTVRGESDQDDAGGVREEFVTANLNGSYRLTEQVSLTARLENLADERYQQVLGYGEPGRSGYVGVRLRY